MHRTTLLATALVVTGAAFTPQAQAQGQQTFPAVTYEVQPGSSHTAGCYFLCLCPIFYIGDLSGTFELTQVTPAPLNFDNYVVSDIDWQVTNLLGDVIMQVRGDGTYRVGGLTGLEHQLVLNLVIDGVPVDTYDTGLITMTGSNAFPDVGVFIAQNDFQCYEEPFNIVAKPAVYDSYCNSLVNSTGEAAVFSASGSRSLTLNDLTLTARHTVPNQPGMFFFGPAQVALPLGNGIRCVGGAPIERFPQVLWADDAGTFSLTVDNLALPDNLVWLAGETWNFQAVYRDPGVGSGLDLTNAGSIQFTP